MALYQQYYCGLCRALKERYGQTDMLNYDAAFIYLLAEGLTDSTPIPPEAVRCALRPVRHPAVISERALHAADLNALMALEKAKDDLRDTSKTVTRLRAGRRARRVTPALQERMPDVFQAASVCGEAIACLEGEGCADPDRAAHPYGKLLGEIFADLDVLQSHVLTDLGYNLGRWTYLIDAWDDREEDRAGGSYNVYLRQAETTGIGEEEQRSRVKFSMSYTLAQAASALDRLELQKNEEILENILRLGLYAQTKSVLEGGGRITLHRPEPPLNRLGS